MYYTKTHEGQKVKEYEPVAYGQLFEKKEAEVLQGFMKEVVENGTGSALKGAGYEAYGKTGSAEYGANKGDSHAWFVGYAHKAGKEDIAVVVLMEGAGSGGTYAAPAAKRIFDFYYGG